MLDIEIRLYCALIEIFSHLLNPWTVHCKQGIASYWYTTGYVFGPPWSALVRHFSPRPSSAVECQVSAAIDVEHVTRAEQH